MPTATDLPATVTLEGETLDVTVENGIVTLSDVRGYYVGRGFTFKGAEADALSTLAREAAAL
jgi:hypothetical protein